MILTVGRVLRVTSLNISITRVASLTKQKTMADDRGKCDLPISRVRMIMKSSPDVSNINQEALFLTAKATVIFSLPTIKTTLLSWVFASAVIGSLQFLQLCAGLLIGFTRFDT